MFCGFKTTSKLFFPFHNSRYSAVIDFMTVFLAFLLFEPRLPSKYFKWRLGFCIGWDLKQYRFTAVSVFSALWLRSLGHPDCLRETPSSPLRWCLIDSPPASYKQVKFALVPLPLLPLPQVLSLRLLTLLPGQKLLVLDFQVLHILC